MRGVISRALVTGALALLVAASGAVAATPAGPRLAVIKASAKPPRLELLTVNRNGGDPLRLAGGSWGAQRPPGPQLDFFSPLSWSSDGEQLAFTGIVRFEKGDDHEAIQKIFTVGADGRGQRAIRGTHEALGPVLSPDGRMVAFTRLIDRETPTTVGGKEWKEGFHGSSIWITDLQTGAQRQLTPWRDGLRYTASSFAPDGSTLLATYEDPMFVNESQPVALALDGGISRRILDDGSEAVYSPDGSKIALVRRIDEYGKNPEENTDLFIVNADGTGLHRLTRTPGHVELSPSWDPSGERLAYVRLPRVRSEGAPFGYRIPLMQVNADGSCQTKVVSSFRTFFFVPVWQPGPGRGAGRIEC
jgi:Tol biopolymer transport system component